MTVYAGEARFLSADFDDEIRSTPLFTSAIAARDALLRLIAGEKRLDVLDA